MYTTIGELINECSITKKPISELMIKQEMIQTNFSYEEIWGNMKNNLHVMRESIEKGSMKPGVCSKTGLTGGEAILIKEYRNNHKTLSGNAICEAIQNAIATNEVNASMGIICATPTAGSAGTLPGIIFLLEKRLNLTEEDMVRFLFTAGAFGMIVANNAMIAGATGGCQAEVGTASAIGAAAAVEVAGGTPKQCSEAFAMAMSNLLGLVCDPVAGLVELPCVKRNAIGTGNALICADMSLAGCTNKIPADEVIEAMRKIGKDLPKALRETGVGGLAGTPTGIKLKNKIFGK